MRGSTKNAKAKSAEGREAEQQEDGGPPADAARLEAVDQRIEQVGDHEGGRERRERAGEQPEQRQHGAGGGEPR